MGNLVNLLQNYPVTKRDTQSRAAEKTEEDRQIARQFGKEFFDGERRTGYGGFNYMPRFWQPVAPTFQDYYNLKAGMKVLDIGCAKGFMVYDFMQLIPGLDIQGIDISDYAIQNAKPEVKDRVQVANATQLPFPDNEFDLVISINTLHNLEGQDLDQAFQEVNRVSKGNAFITVDAYNTEEEKESMFAWNLTAKTILSAQDWIKYFEKVNYKGDYYWFIP